MKQENRDEILQLTKEVETLEQQTTQQKILSRSCKVLLQAKDLSPIWPQNDKEQAEKIATPYSSAQLATANALLRSKFEEGGSSLLAADSKSMHALQEFFSPPTNSIVTTPFKRNMGHCGVDIVAKEGTPIKCVANGVVIFLPRLWKRVG